MNSPFSWIMTHFSRGLDVDATAAAEGYKARPGSDNPYQIEPSRVSWFLANKQRSDDEREEK